MARKVSLAAMVLLVGIAGLMLAGEYSVLRRSEQTCSICKRHINRKAGVVAEIGGKRRHVCCAHCALTEGAQEHKPVRLLSVTDYNSGATLTPREAWYVEGSRVMACEHDMAPMDTSKRGAEMAFDRCSPGTFAFATREQAEAFAAHNGGAVRSHDELMKTFGVAEDSAPGAHDHAAMAVHEHSPAPAKVVLP